MIEWHENNQCLSFPIEKPEGIKLIEIRLTVNKTFTQQAAGCPVRWMRNLTQAQWERRKKLILLRIAEEIGITPCSEMSLKTARNSLEYTTYIYPGFTLSHQISLTATAKTSSQWSKSQYGQLSMAILMLSPKAAKGLPPLRHHLSGSRLRGSLIHSSFTH